MSEKWWDMSDDELDDLFREASDRVDVPFDSSAYNKLRQKIVEQPMSEPPRGFKKRWLLLLAGLFLMVGVGLVYRFGNDLKVNNSTEIVENIKEKSTVKPLNVPLSVPSQTTGKSSLPLSVSSQTTEKSFGENLAKFSERKQTTRGTATKETQLITKSSVGTQTTAEETQTTVEAKSFVNTGTHIQTTPEAPLNSKADETYNLSKSENNLLNNSRKVVDNKQVTFGLNDSKTYAIEQNKVIENIDFESINKKNKLIRFNNSKNSKDREGKSYPATLQIIGQNTLPVSENSSNIQEQIVPEETINRTDFYNVDFLKNKDLKSLLTNIRAELPEYVDSLPRTIKPVKFSTFGVRLMLSPDFNSIDNLGKMALGGSLGLLFEYKISKKLVVQTGIVYSSKSYVGSFDDYRNWKDWKGYHPSKPTQVDGGCKVFDIPINIRLNLFQKPKQTWFVSSGVSSYWMMNENYTYNYAWTPSRAVGWNDNSKYYFSVLNFSVGLERQISKHFNIQIEPYLKTPLKSVGRGGVNLYSSGVLFSTKYEF